MLHPTLPPDEARRERIRQWTAVRSQGRRAFILRAGVLRGGLPLGLATLAAAFVREVGLAWPPAPLPERLRLPFAAALAVFCLVGWWMGERAWLQGEAVHRRLTGERDHPVR